jgi:NitT/TauT family transport system substrate-binding protein
VIAVLAVLVAACGGGAPATPSPTPAAPVELAIGLGYIPSVQFAQFYLAEQAGYYRDAGLEVTFENKIDPELITLVGQGAFDVGIADGTSVIPAVSQGIPVRYVFTVYADFPSIVFAKASSGITGPADLAGRKVGIPGRYGSSWIQLQALLAGAGLTPADLEIVPFPDFGQLAALEQGVVDAATGFVNNEPIRMELAGTPAVVLALPADSQLPGNGLIVGQAALDGPKADAIRAFIAATRQAMGEIAANPQKGLEAAIARVPELAGDRAAQLAVLEATIATWQNDYTAANGIGAVDAAAWERSIAFMSGLPESPVAKPISAADCIDATFAAQ